MLTCNFCDAQSDATGSGMFVGRGGRAVICAACLTQFNRNTDPIAIRLEVIIDLLKKSQARPITLNVTALA